MFDIAYVTELNVEVARQAIYDFTHGKTDFSGMSLGFAISCGRYHSVILANAIILACHGGL